MRVAVLHSKVTDASAPDELDVLAQVDAVSSALKNLRHEPFPVPMSLDMAAAMTHLSREKPDFVFNLVEGLDGVGRFIYFAPAVLDQLGLPYSGSPTNAIYVSTNKILSKQTLRQSDLPTPAWFNSNHQLQRHPSFPPPYLIKPVWEDASVGIDDDSMVYKSHLDTILRQKTKKHGECLVEAYIAGREFNISVLAGADGPEVLPPAEMLFRDYPPEKPRIVDYRAKWDESSFEYQNTVRTFDFPASDDALLEKMRHISLKCWKLFELRGYARVDFRVDATGQPWVLEVNANPCISPDSGFVAASLHAGLAYEQVIDRIIRDTIKTD